MERTTRSLKIVRQKTFSFLLLAIGAILSADAGHPLHAQKLGHAIATKLVQNVVQVRAKWGGNSQDGFGFIFGKEAGLIYIATANHVVRENSTGQIDRAPTIIFSRFQGIPYQGKLLETSSDLIDLAVIAVEASNVPELTWKSDAIAATSSVIDGSPVWFIGLERKWFIPPTAGRVTSLSEVKRTYYAGKALTVAGLNVNAGTSGAPLISNDGIVGMIVSDSSKQEVEAIPIERIEETVRSWQQPWQLTVILPPQDCDRLAASPMDPGRPADVTGAELPNMDGGRAVTACIIPYLSYVEKIPRFAFQMGRALEANKQLKEAEMSYSVAAKKGYAAAQSRLGSLYEQQNREEDAAELYRLAADQGDPAGQTSLGTMYRDEYGGLPKNDVLAIQLYREAASKNYPPALSSLGWMYEQGRGGVSPNESEARRLYDQAAAKGDVYAERALRRLGF